MGIPISFSLMDFERFFLWVLVCKCICTFYFKGKTGINNVKQINKQANKQTNKQTNKNTNTTFVNLRRVYFSIFILCEIIHTWKVCLDNNMTLFLKVCVLKISQYSKENTCVGVSFLIKLQVWSPREKKRLQHSFLPMNITKFSRTAFL